MLALLAAAQPAILVPAYAAYSEPSPDGIEVEGGNASSGWRDTGQSLVWYGEARRAGKLRLWLSMVGLPPGRLTLTVGRERRVAIVDGGTVEFGTFDVKAGPVRVALATDAAPMPPVFGLGADGDVHWATSRRRNAASVHLRWPTPKDADVRWFYNEATMLTDPSWSYTMACGFARGYFGMQVNDPGRRCVIFSVWDAGKEAVDRAKVGAADRVELVAKGNGVFADSFGNEGTGGHSHFDVLWKTGKPLRFLVGCRPEGDKTLYAGYWMGPGDKAWRLVSAFRAPKDGRPLRDLYSFSEDYVGSNGQKWRESAYGNGWIGLADGSWQPLTEARFTTDGHGRTERWDTDAYVTGGRFHLRHGGFVSGRVSYGEKLTLADPGRRPRFDLPTLPNRLAP